MEAISKENLQNSKQVPKISEKKPLLEPILKNNNKIIQIDLKVPFQKKNILTNLLKVLEILKVKSEKASVKGKIKFEIFIVFFFNHVYVF